MNYYITQGTILNIFEYSIITYKGEKSEKEHIYIYMNYFAVQLKLTQHCISCICKKNC